MSSILPCQQFIETPFSQAFILHSSTASLSISIASTYAPNLAAAMDKIPVPHPTSITLSPCETYFGIKESII